MTIYGERYAPSEVAREIVAELPFASYAKALRIYDAIFTFGMSANDIAFIACNDRFFLLTMILKREDALHEWIYDRCREVEADPDDHLDLWARGHYKSTIITFAGVIQEIIRDPEITIGIFSVKEDVSRPFLKQIMEEIEGNEDLRLVYFPDVFHADPRHEADRWGVDVGIVVKRAGTPKEATVEAHGIIQGMPTGRHFALRIYDDLINEYYLTPPMIEKATKQWEMSSNLGGGPRRSQYIGTRYLFGDTYSVMMSRNAVKPRLHAATHDGTLNGTPVYLTAEAWAKIKNEQRSTVAAQMLQNPVAGEDTTFRPEWLIPYFVRPRMMNVYIMVDPSKGRSKTSDNTAMAVIGVDAQLNKYLLDGYCHHMSLSERWMNFRALWLKWSKAKGVAMVELGYEQYGLLTDIEYFEERIQIERLSMPEIKELNWARDAQTQSKEDRVERLEPAFRNEGFYVPGKVWAPVDGLCTWSVTDNSFPVLKKFDADSGFVTREEADAIRTGQSWRIVTPIRRIDSESKPYDLTRVFFEEFCYFPFSPRKDLIDATSRIHDMEIVPPAPMDLKALAPLAARDA